MALLQEDKKPFYSNTETGLRLSIFGAHALSAVFMLAKAYGAFDGADCKGEVYATTRMVTQSDPYLAAIQPVVYPLEMARIRNLTDCAHDNSWKHGWCKAIHLPNYVDYENDVDSFVFGSSWNIIFSVTVFEWITASYALLYFDPFDSWLSFTSLWWGLHPIPVAATVWNLVLLILMWASRPTLNVPFNNAFLYTMALATTIILQNFLAINRASRIDKETEEEPAYVENAKQVEVKLRFDHFLRNRKRPADKGYQRIAQSPALGADFHEHGFISIIEKAQNGVIPRYLEYSMTAPLLLVGLYASSIPFDLTWKFQYIVVSLLACNAVGIPLHQSVISIPDEGKDTGRFTKASGYFFVASWLCLVAGLYVMVYSLRTVLLESPDKSGMPGWVLVLLWMMLVLYSMFGFIVSRYYVPRMIWGTHITDEQWKWCYFYLDLCSLFIKLPVAWTIWTKGAIINCDKYIAC